MDSISLIVSWSFVALFGYFLARMTWNIGQNLAQGRLVRRQLHERLAGLPLERALQRSGSDAMRYLHTRQIHAIERELHNCANCQAASGCKEALDAGAPTEKFDFCPNYTTLFKR